MILTPSGLRSRICLAVGLAWSAAAACRDDVARSADHPPVPFVLDDRPVLDLGRVSTTPDLEFVFPRALHRTRDGRILIAETPETEVRLVDSVGAFLKIVARQGGGPGEIPGGSAVIAAPLSGDTVGLLVAATGSLYIYDSAFRFVRSVPITAPPMMGLRHLIFRDGTVLVEHRRNSPCLPGLRRNLPVGPFSETPVT
jgi:hypothetical protein